MDEVTAKNDAEAGLKRRREAEFATGYKSMFIHAAEDFPESDNEEETDSAEIKLTGGRIDVSNGGTKRGLLWFSKRAKTVKKDLPETHNEEETDTVEINLTEDRVDASDEGSKQGRQWIKKTAESVKKNLPETHNEDKKDTVEINLTGDRVNASNGGTKGGGLWISKTDEAAVKKDRPESNNKKENDTIEIKLSREHEVRVRASSPPFGSLEEMFSKKRTLKSMNDRFNVPTSFYMDRKWKDSELDTLKTHINGTKSLLDEMNLQQWHTHTKRMNPAGEVPILLRKKFAPEYCSQAWCKMFECLSSYPVIPKSLTDAARQPGLKAPVPFCSVHLCEAPGAFVSATNHFLRTRFNNIKWKWLGTTLNPYFEGNDVGSMINEDQLMISSRDNWTFLKDTTGNIMNEANIDSLKEEVKIKFSGPNGIPVPVSLVTADGSIDCQSFPAEQECIVAKLQFSEIIAALSILHQGGSFVLKIFTFFENQSISHLYILCSVFREVHLHKPATSKEGNSEVYVVCLGYYGSFMFEAEIQKLKKLLGEYEERVQGFSLVQRSLIRSGQFLDRVVGASKFFTLAQDAVIRRNLDHFRLQIDSRYYTSDIMRQELANEWVHRFQVKKLSVNFRLFGKDVLLSKLKSACHVDPRGESGTFKDKIKRLNANDAEKLDCIKRDLSAFADLHDHRDWVTVPLKLQYGDLQSLFVPSEGKKFVNLHSSRFCFGKPLQLKEEFRQMMTPSLAKKVATLQLFSPPEQVKEDLAAIFPDVHLSDLNNWKLFYHYCGENIFDTVFLKDVRKLQVDLIGIMEKFHRMRLMTSLFVSEFPLLSRLHVGIMCALSAFFKSTHICYGLKGKPKGVMFHRLIDTAKTTHNGRSEVVKILFDIMYRLNSSDAIGITELVPLKTLINLEIYKNIFDYNMCNVICSLNAEISLAQRVFEAKRRT